MPMATIRPVSGEAGLYHIHFLDAAPGHPDQGLPGGRPGRPDQGLPGGGGGHPDQGLPGGRPGRPDQGLPGGGGHPDQGLPGGGRPDQGLPGGGGGGGHIGQLPSAPPPTLLPGWTLLMVRTPDGKWHYASAGPGHPVQPLPDPIPPGGRPDQGLPPQQPPHASGQPTPPQPGAGHPTNPIAPTPAPKPV